MAAFSVQSDSASYIETGLPELTMLSRRRFLRLAGLSALAAWPPNLPRSPLRQDAPPQATGEPILVGRAVDYAGVFERPSYTSTKVGHLGADDLIPIYEVLQAEGGYNKTWFRTDAGYVYSANVVPMKPYIEPPPVVEDVGAWGVWVEVVAPWSDSYAEPRADSKPFYRLYYSSVYRVIQAQQGVDGAWWYQITDSRYNELYWAQAAGLRAIAPEELAPIHPGVKDKRIEINLTTMYLYAYEGDEEVRQAEVAVGNTFFWEDGTTDYFDTPTGAFRVMLKAPSRHMGSRGTLGSFDYPGVPWCTFFHDKGLALHGTYWHNDYGIKRSHGCVNLRPEDALWIYRWTYPEAPYEAETLPAGHVVDATPIYIF